jgi:hypothetical protein
MSTGNFDDIDVGLDERGLGAVDGVRTARGGSRSLSAAARIIFPVLSEHGPWTCVNL